MIVAENLTKRYGGRGGVAGLHLSVGTGEIVGLVGANGAGKSTTLRTLLGLLRPDAGSVRIGAEGYEPDHKAARAQMGYIPEMPELYTDLSAWEHLKFLGMIYGLDERTASERAEALLRRLELWERRDEDPLSYSKGMRQRLSVACALLHDPQVLLADEPWSGLDPLASFLLKEIFQELKGQGKALLISTHMLDTAERLCDRFVLLAEGTVAAQGSLDAIRETAGVGTDATLEEAFVTILRRRRLGEG